MKLSLEQSGSRPLIPTDKGAKKMNLKLAVCAVFDKKAEEYQYPFVVPNKATAVRDFIRACKEEKSNLYQFASDYRLEHLADFYPNNGVFELVNKKTVLCEAENVVVKNEQKA